ncbi:MAG TPA: response regulator [Chitinophagaceae bacterium]|jgi:CheY-like chemotaxis protein|nr:response regulator [Chitinophagaceae bacterium]
MDVVHILLVEDNEGDIILTTEAFKDMQLENRISIVKDGEEALLFLRRQGKYKDVSSPQLILMDIHLPGINGKDLLEIIKQDEELKEIPVVMLTSSDKDADISDCYEKQVNWYITKPIDYDKYTKVMHEIEAFYVSFVPYDKMMR